MSLKKKFSSLVRASNHRTRSNVGKANLPCFSCNQSNLSGVTYWTTGKCLELGCKYWPIVMMLTPFDLKSFMVLITSCSVSPSPNIKDDFVYIVGLRLLIF